MSGATLPTTAQLRAKMESLDRGEELVNSEIARRTESLASAAVDDTALADESDAIARLQDQKRVMASVRRITEQRVADAVAREDREALLAKVSALDALQAERVAAAVELNSLLPRIAELLESIHGCQERCQRLAALPNRVLGPDGWVVCEINNMTVGDTAPSLVNNMLAGLAGAHWPFGEQRGADLVGTIKRQRVQYLSFVAAATGTEAQAPAVASVATPLSEVRRLYPKRSGVLEGALLVTEETSLDDVNASREAFLRERAAAHAAAAAA